MNCALYGNELKAGVYVWWNKEKVHLECAIKAPKEQRNAAQ